MSIKSAPSELHSRADDVGVEPTEAWLLNEARYVVSMIRDGGCDYNDTPDRGAALMRECERFISRCAP